MKSIYILHEGHTSKSSDGEIIRLLVKHLEEQKDSKVKSADIEYHGMGSKSNFFKKEMYVSKPSPYNKFNANLIFQGVQTNQINKVLFVVDADNSINDTKTGGFKNTQNALNEMIIELGFQSVASIYIMCDPDTGEGYLESFILATIPPEQKNCIQCFLDCSQFKSKENHKDILNKIYKLAYPDAPYDFSHAHFDLLKTELINLFN